MQSTYEHVYSYCHLLIVLNLFLMFYYFSFIFFSYHLITTLMLYLDFFVCVCVWLCVIVLSYWSLNFKFISNRLHLHSLLLMNVDYIVIFVCGWFPTFSIYLPLPAVDKRRALQTNTTDEHRCKNSQQVLANKIQQHIKRTSLLPSEIYPRDMRIFQYSQISAIYHKNNLKNKKHMIVAAKVSEKTEHWFIIKTL